MSRYFVRDETWDDHALRRSKRRKRSKKCEGFDTTYVGFGRDLTKYICDDTRSPCCGLVRLYAKMGLHRYNLFQGTNLQFMRVKKYNMSEWSPAGSYYITLVATDPASSKCITFQAKVDEMCHCKLILMSQVARPRGTHTEDEDITANRVYRRSGILPNCPPEDLFENRKRFYVVKESELQQNDWIRLYLELAVATAHKATSRNHDLSNLKIVKVAIETSEDLEPPNEGSLNAIPALVYIRYEDSCESRVGKDVDRIAMVKRSFNEDNGCFILEGWNKAIKSELAHGIQKRRSICRY